VFFLTLDAGNPPQMHPEDSFNNNNNNNNNNNVVIYFNFKIKKIVINNNTKPIYRTSYGQNFRGVEASIYCLRDVVLSIGSVSIPPLLQLH